MLATAAASPSPRKQPPRAAAASKATSSRPAPTSPPVHARRSKTSLHTAGDGTSKTKACSPLAPSPDSLGSLSDSVPSLSPLRKTGDRHVRAEAASRTTANKTNSKKPASSRHYSLNSLSDNDLMSLSSSPRKKTGGGQLERSQRRIQTNFFDPTASNKQGLFVGDDSSPLHSMTSSKKTLEKGLVFGLKVPMSKIRPEDLAATMGVTKGRIPMSKIRPEDLAATMGVAKGRIPMSKIRPEDLAATMGVAKGRIPMKRSHREDNDNDDDEPVKKKCAKTRVRASGQSAQDLATAAILAKRKGVKVPGKSRDKVRVSDFAPNADDDDNDSVDPRKKKKKKPANSRGARRSSVSPSAARETAASVAAAQERARKDIVASRNTKRLGVSYAASDDDDDDDEEDAWLCVKGTGGSSNALAAAIDRSRKERGTRRDKTTTAKRPSDLALGAETMSMSRLLFLQALSSKPSAGARPETRCLELQSLGSDTESESGAFFARKKISSRSSILDLALDALTESGRSKSSSLPSNGSAEKKSKHRPTASKSKNKVSNEAASRKKEPEIIIIDDDDEDVAPKKKIAKPTNPPAADDESADTMEDVVMGETLTAAEALQRKFDKAEKTGEMITLD